MLPAFPQPLLLSLLLPLPGGAACPCSCPCPGMLLALAPAWGCSLHLLLPLPGDAPCPCLRKAKGPGPSRGTRGTETTHPAQCWATDGAGTVYSVWGRGLAPFLISGAGMPRAQCKGRAQSWGCAVFVPLMPSLWQVPLLQQTDTPQPYTALLGPGATAELSGFEASPPPAKALQSGSVVGAVLGTGWGGLLCPWY